MRYLLLSVTERIPEVTGEATPAAISEDSASDTAFDTRTVALISAGHFAHDSYPAFIGVLLPVLSRRLGIDLAAAGVLASGLRWTTLIQPLLGYWADRTDTRYWVIVAPTTTAALISLLGVAPNYVTVLVLLLMTGLSHAAFHPAAGAMVTRSAGTQWGKGMSFFMTGGELGRAVGPLYIASLLGAVGPQRTWIAFFPGLLASLIIYRRIGKENSLPLRHPPGDMRQALRSERRALAILGGAVILRSIPVVGIATFYPTLATNVGTTLLIAGLAVTIYEVGGTVGAFVGGILSDRYGRRRVLAVAVLGGVPLLIGALVTGPTVTGICLLALGAFAIFNANAVELVMVQEMLPDNRSAAVGVTYFVKTSGSIVAMIAVGALGELIGLREALLVGCVMAALSVPLIVALPETRRHRPHESHVST